MSEVLAFKVDAVSNRLLVELDAVDPESGAVIVGVPRPLVTVTLGELAKEDAKLVRDLRAILVALEPIARARFAAAATPQQTVAKAAELAAKEAELAERESRLAKQEAKAAASTPPE